jgi:S1-C subfamily serine protease
VIVELAGAPVTKVSAVISAVRAQPPGTWLPLRVRRGKDLMELVVRFPGRA